MINIVPPVTKIKSVIQNSVLFTALHRVYKRSSSYWVFQQARAIAWNIFQDLECIKFGPFFIQQDSNLYDLTYGIFNLGYCKLTNPSLGTSLRSVTFENHPLKDDSFHLVLHYQYHNKQNHCPRHHLQPFRHQYLSKWILQNHHLSQNRTRFQQNSGLSTP